MNRENLEIILEKVKVNKEKFFAETNAMSKKAFLGKKIKFKNTSIINDNVESEICIGLVEDVTVTTDCDLMIEVKNIETEKTNIIFSYDIIETE